MVDRPRAIGRRYTLQRQIGQGGMGAVWLAVDDVLGREVAVKRVGLFPGGTSPDLMRAQREAKLAAKLNHPHVVSVFDFVTEGDEQWLVMEHVAGTNLSALAEEQGGLAPAEAAAIVGQVAEALAAAHSAGVVHRDVKPSNILVTTNGTAKLADFGIARARADSTMTASGMVTGTPAYLAPEVASGKTATEASDVWSLGATLFHTLTGRPPYDLNDNVLAAMYRIVHDEPPRLPEIGWPAGLLESTMALDPAARWPMSRVSEYLSTPPPDAGQGPAATSATTVLPVVAEESTLSVPAVESAAAPVEDEPVAPALDLDEDWAEGADATPVEQPSRRGGLPVLILLAFVLLAGIVGWALLRGGDTPSVAERPGGTKTARAASPTHSPSPPKSDRPSPPTPVSTGTTTSDGSGGSAQSVSNTADRMSSFVEDYIAKAVSDPASAWDDLTPRFQEHVGSYGDYAGYWNTIESATLRDVRADPRAMTVSYIITWDPKGPRGKEDESVVLELVKENGRYLIDWER
jgi:eukaryotic-like serine/threonine-protein kinase